MGKKKNDEDRMKDIYDNNEMNDDLRKLFGVDEAEIPEELEEKLSELPSFVAKKIRKRILDELEKNPNTEVHLLNTDVEVCPGCGEVHDEDNHSTIIHFKCLRTDDVFYGSFGDTMKAVMSDDRIPQFVELEVLKILDYRECSKKETMEWVLSNDLILGIHSLTGLKVMRDFSGKVDESKFTKWEK